MSVLVTYCSLSDGQATYKQHLIGNKGYIIDSVPLVTCGAEATPTAKRVGYLIDVVNDT